MQNSQLKLNHISQFAADCLRCYDKGVNGTIPFGGTTNVDLLMPDDVFITGGMLNVKGGVFNDTVTFQVVDKDNVLGYGNNVVLGEYITNWGIIEDSQRQFDEKQDYPAKVYAGLYLRIIYTSTGESDVQLSMNYRLHKAMI